MDSEIFGKGNCNASLGRNALKGKDFIPGCREICNLIRTIVQIFLETANVDVSDPGGNIISLVEAG